MSRIGLRKGLKIDMENKGAFNDKKIWVYVLSAGVILFFPIIINLIVKQDFLPYVFGDGEMWLSFFGSYFGGAIGAIVAAIVAVYVAKMQVEEARQDFNLQMEVREKEELEKARVYPVINTIIGDWNMERIPIHNGKLVDTFDYYYLINNTFMSETKINIIHFLELKMIGVSKFILDCNILIKVKGSSKEVILPNDIIKQNDLPYVNQNNEIKLVLPVILTDETWYIPLVNAFKKEEYTSDTVEYKNYTPTQISIKYTTPKHERMHYKINYAHSTEQLFYVKNDEETEILSNDLSHIAWKAIVKKDTH